MPLYRFHLHDDLVAEDEEGLDLPGPDAAREQAIESARELVCAHIRQYGNVNLDHYIDVADESGAILFRITFRDAFTVEGERPASAALGPTPAPGPRADPDQ